MKTTLTFDLTEDEEIRAFARLIRELNETGVPYNVSQSDNNRTIFFEIGDGY